VAPCGRHLGPQRLDEAIRHPSFEVVVLVESGGGQAVHLSVSPQIATPRTKAGDRAPEKGRQPTEVLLHVSDTEASSVRLPEEVVRRVGRWAEAKSPRDRQGTGCNGSGVLADRELVHHEQVPGERRATGSESKIERPGD